MVDKKVKLSSNHKSFVAGGAGALVAILLVLSSVGVVRAFSGPQGHGQNGKSALMMGAERGGDMQGDPGRGLGGEITKIDGSTITLKGREDQIVTVTVDDNTNYKNEGNDAKLSDLKVGDKIMVRGDVTTVSVNADTIGIR